MILNADARHIPLADESVNCVVTSPPYWGLRDYGIEPSVWGGREDCAHEWKTESRAPQSGGTGEASAKQVTNGGTQGSVQTPIESAFCLLCSAWRGVLGLEPTPELYVSHMVTVFREVWRVLRKDGTCWVNLGDSYAANGGWSNNNGLDGVARANGERASNPSRQRCVGGLKPKDLCGIPWRVAFALQAAGWWLRSDIIWSKPNPMPESVTDRPTKSHEYIFLLSKSSTYYFDQDAVREPHVRLWDESNGGGMATSWHDDAHIGGSNRELRPYPLPNPAGRNIRSVWTMATQPFPDAHFATFPEELAKRCILAGCPLGGVVLDPFCGSGTTVKAAKDCGRIGIGLDLKPDYLAMAQRRTAQEGLGL